MYFATDMVFDGSFKTDVVVGPNTVNQATRVVFEGFVVKEINSTNEFWAITKSDIPLSRGVPKALLSKARCVRFVQVVISLLAFRRFLDGVLGGAPVVEMILETV